MEMILTGWNTSLDSDCKNNSKGKDRCNKGNKLHLCHSSSKNLRYFLKKQLQQSNMRC